MPLHRQTAEMLAGLAALGLPPLEELTPVDAREQRRAMLRPSAEEVAEVREIDAGGVPARLYAPVATRSAG